MTSAHRGASRTRLGFSKSWHPNLYRMLWAFIETLVSYLKDVGVWEPTILDLFRTLGNSYCNFDVGEAASTSKSSPPRKDKMLRYQRSQNSNLTVPGIILTNVDAIQSASKPSLKDAFHEKEKYILAKAMLLSVADKATLEKCCLNSKVTLLLGTPGKVLLKVQKCSLLSKATLFASLGYTLLGWP
ncbi:hypothetical protein H5410_027967 [Solanum commersonii]|uniref:Uncharacterized protein n=1 Tax=Solanum commersonii TaxID=4109 RepID=A0A9J5Z0L8_SOLCO|nr:hypothetical protein H5410_027967 [Solanum commersonii]